MKYLPLITLIPLVKLAFDDFRSREVALSWLVVFAAGVAGVTAVTDGWHELLTRIWQNMILVACLGAGVTIWVWARSRRLINPVNTYIGSGDVLFFVALAPLFPLERYAYLIVACNIFSLIWWLAMRLTMRLTTRLITHRTMRRGNKTPKTIPLVATSSFVVGAAVMASIFFE